MRIIDLPRLYYIPNQGAQLTASQDFIKQIVSGIESSFPRADTAGTWTLSHRMLRDVPPYKEHGQTDYAHAYQHLLHVSTVSPDRTYNLIQYPPQTTQKDIPQAAVASIPLAQTDTHFAFLVNQLPLLWAPQRVLDIPNGKIYQAGDFLIHIGEFRSRRQASTGVPSSPAVVVCISTEVGGPEDEVEGPSTGADESITDFDYAQESIRELWNAIKKDATFSRDEIPIREFMQLAQDPGHDKELGREAVVRMWCAALSPRA